MFRKSLLALALLAGSLPATASFAQTPAATLATAPKTTLTVSVSGLRNEKGQVMIQLWNQPDGFPTKGDKGYELINVDANKAVSGTVTVTFYVPAGTYAVSTLHDENKNNKMDTNAFGIPKEGYSASNNFVTHLHAPSFEQAKAQIPSSGQKIAVSMRY